MDKIKPELQMYERKPDSLTTHAEGFNRNKYVSIQDKVNNDPVFAHNYINKLIEEGWVKLANNSDLIKPTMKGRHFKYRLNGKSMSKAEAGTFRSGGIIIGTGDDNDPNYILYKAYNGCIFPLQIIDLEAVYVKNPNEKIQRKSVPKVINSTVYFDFPSKVTPFPVYLTSKLTGKEVVVRYARDNHDRERFKLTKKYEYAYRTGDWQII